MDNVDWQNFARPLPILNKVQRLLKTCLLCSRRQVHVIGMFIPDPNYQALFFDDVPNGVTRERYYALCRRCFTRNRQSRCQIVEDKFIAMIAAERAEKGQTVQ